MHKHQRKKGSALPQVPRSCLVSTNICSRSESASQEQRRRLTIMTITASDDGRIHPRDVLLCRGDLIFRIWRTDPGGHRAQSVSSSKPM